MRDNSAGRTNYSADEIVVQWIERESPAPRHLVPLLHRYRDLTIVIDDTDPKCAALDQLNTAQNGIYDQLVAAAQAKLTISAQAAHQLRRIQRRQEARLTLGERAQLAAAGDPRAADWGPMEAYVRPYQPKAGVRS